MILTGILLEQNGMKKKCYLIFILSFKMDWIHLQIREAQETGRVVEKDALIISLYPIIAAPLKMEALWIQT